MAATKCPSCGAGILEGSGKFCSFCGALLPDDIHRAELKIENVSDMARLEFEREQARKQEEKEKKAKKAKLIRSVLSIIIPAIMLLTGVLMLKSHYIEPLGFLLAFVGGIFSFFGILGALLSLIVGPNNNNNNSSGKNK